MNKRGIIFLLCFITLLLLFCFYKQYKYTESFIESEIQLVIARYNEDLKWLNSDPFSKYNNIIYNKSDNNNFETSNKTEKVVQLQNVGRCDHTYIYHIIENYDKLATITVFLPGSVNMEYKFNKSKRLLMELEKSDKNVFITESKHNNVKDDLYDFQLDSWKASDAANASLNNEKNLEKSNIRPFGKWYEDKFKNIKIENVTYGGIFSVSKKEILQHPKSYYENLIKDLETSSNPEVGHYFERSWNAIFYPMTETKFI